MNKLFYLGILSLIISCNTSHTCSNIQYTHELSLKDSLTLPLDSVSGAMSKGLFFVEGNPDLLIKANLNNWRIDYYNLEKRVLNGTTTIYKEGANGVGQIPSGIHFHNRDSIFLYFNLQQSLKLINSKGELVDFYDFTKNRTPIIDIRSYRPAFLYKGELFMSTYDNSYDGNNTSGATLNLKTGELVYPYKIPGLYETGYWQGILYDNLISIMGESESIINSYGADHHIYVIDSKGNTQMHCAKSNYLDDIIEPYSKGKLDFGSHAQEIYKFEALQGGYSYMLYDKYQNVYYRVALPPVSNSNFNSPQQLFEQPSIVILNKDFKKIGETLLPKGHKHTGMFISSEGLNILNIEDYKNNENRVMYSIFKVDQL